MRTSCPAFCSPLSKEALVGCGLAWGGFLLPALKPLYAYGWFVGFFASGTLYWALSAGQAPRRAPEPAPA